MVSNIKYHVFVFCLKIARLDTVRYLTYDILGGSLTGQLSSSLIICHLLSHEIMKIVLVVMLRLGLP